MLRRDDGDDVGGVDEDLSLGSVLEHERDRGLEELSIAVERPLLAVGDLAQEQRALAAGDDDRLIELVVSEGWAKDLVRDDHVDDVAKFQVARVDPPAELTVSLQAEQIVRLERTEVEAVGTLALVRRVRDRDNRLAGDGLDGGSRIGGGTVRARDGRGGRKRSPDKGARRGDRRASISGRRVQSHGAADRGHSGCMGM